MRGKLGWETYCAFQGKEQARQGKWVYDWQVGILLTGARAQGLPLGMIRTGGYWPGVEEPCESLIQEVVGGYSSACRRLAAFERRAHRGVVCCI